MDVEKALEKLQDLPFKDLGYAKIDNHREIRVGYPEVIYCAGKTVEQIKGIIEFMVTKKNNILGTRASKEVYEAVKSICPKAEYNEEARTITIKNKEMETNSTYISIVTAGTSDIPVAEEAAVTAEIFGNKVERIYDVGVAGIHRLFDRLEIIRQSKVIIVVAGMEGALASVLGGLVDKPVIAVPTSVGYGANFGGLSALLCMLNSCASGISVVNIDNGFGAGYLSSMINKL
ncbi:nickel pincer cofactor biosynthesis protein LarB [Clostridium drakei]